METFNETKLNRMINSAYEIHYGKQKGIDMSHLIPHTLHQLQDGSGLQMILAPRHKVAGDGVIKMTEFLRDMNGQGIVSHGITPQMVTTMNNSVGKLYDGSMARSHSGKGSGKVRKTHRGGNIHLTGMSGGDIGNSLKSALVPSLIAISPMILKSLGGLVMNRDTKKFKEDLKQIGVKGLGALGTMAVKNEIGYHLNPTKSARKGYDTSSKANLVGKSKMLGRNF
tara:strand:- start:4734 stop:5408 length:675 start_codon:yes stop_codon:yes gene_type:complete